MSNNEESSGKLKSIPQDFNGGQLRCEIQDLRNETEGLRETIAILETNWEAFNRESGKAKGELEELRSRFQELSQELAARDNKLKEVNQTHEALVRELKREIEEKSLRNTELEKQVANIRSQYQLKVRSLEEQVGQRGHEVENLRHESQQLRQTIATLEADSEIFTRERSEIKGQLEESIDRLQVLSRDLTGLGKEQERVQSRHGEEGATPEETQKLGATYEH